MISTSDLYFVSLNESAPKTIVLIHGAFSSHFEWNLVSKHLQAYHLLIPDLPGHGSRSSRHIPFSIPHAAQLISELIAEHAHDGTADIVGMSLGGYITMYLAGNYPGSVRDCFITGCHQTWDDPYYAWFMGFSMAASAVFLMSLPTSWFMHMAAQNKMAFNMDLYNDMRKATSFKLGITIGKSMGVNNPKTWTKVEARTLQCTGEVEMLAKDVSKATQYLRNGECRVVEGMDHAWDLQRPGLFANGVLCWLGQRELPERFKDPKEFFK